MNRKTSTFTAIIHYAAIFIALFAANAFAQRELTVDYVDSMTQVYFDNREWGRLINIGERALKEGIESYQLRVRLGISYTESGNIFDAVPHFEKAVSTGFSDGTVKQYLYNNYVIAGREEDASIVLYEMTNSRRKKLRPLINDFINDVRSDFGYSVSTDDADNGSIDIDGADNFYGEQTINRNEFFFDIGIGQLPLRWMKINYAYTYLNIDREKQIMFNDEKISDNYKQKQGRLFNEFRFVPANGLIISPSGHFINSKETVAKAVFDSASAGNMLSIGKNQSRYFYSLKDTSISRDNFVLSVTASKWISIFKANVSGSFSYLNGSHQSQYGISIKAFPLKNPDLSITSDAVIHNQNSVTNLIFRQSAEGRISGNLTLEAFLTAGRINNYNEENGFMIYNDPDVINLCYGARLKYVFPFNMSLHLYCSGQNREKKYQTNIITGYQNNIPQYHKKWTSAEYSTILLAFGIKYDF